jgi:hypothetical protein
LGKTGAQFNLILAVEEINGMIRMELTYAAELFKHMTIKKVLARYIEILRQVVRDKEILLKDISLSHDFLISKSNKYREERCDFSF